MGTPVQKTVSKQATLSGVGVHSGAETVLKIKPGAAGSGIVFVRTDITDCDNVVPATYDRVTETTLCTVIENDAGVSVSTIEHLMAALRACDIDNAIIELDGPEVPIMDGSARPFMRVIDQVGVTYLDAPRQAIRVLKEVTYTEGDKFVTLRPSDSSVFDITIEFDNNVIGRQRAAIDMQADDFETYASDARTFGFLHEVEYLKSKGLARGGSLHNAVVIEGNRVLNPEGLRYDDEFARHKLLDAVGDLYLAGFPILGYCEGYKAGHAMNNGVLRTLFADPSNYEIVDMVEDDMFMPDVLPVAIYATQAQYATA